MKLQSILLGSVLVIAACGKKDENKSSSSSSSPTAAAPGATAAAAPAAPAASGEIKTTHNCDQLLPAAVRDKHFKDKTITQKKPLAAHDLTCEIDFGEGAGVSVATTCLNGVYSQRQMVFDSIKKMSPDAAEITDIGRGGMSHSMGPVKQVTVIDDTADCSINVTAGTDTVDAKAIAKDVVAVFPPS